jgi:high-affinity nickel permease
VSGVDQFIAGHGVGGSLLAVLAISLLLGLRHASDPDHLVAVSTLVAAEPKRGVRRAGRVGLAWSLGHATTLVALGLPIVLVGVSLPRSFHRAAETLVGLVVVALAVRLLRQRSSHPHRIRSPFQAFAVGLLHGAGGSAAVTVLVLATVPDRTAAAVALLVFASGTAVSMALLSSGFGFALTRDAVARRFGRLASGLAAFSLAFGAWYAAGAAL